MRTNNHVSLTARKAGKNIVYTVTDYTTTVDGIQIATRRGHVAYRAVRVCAGEVIGYHKTIATAEKTARRDNEWAAERDYADRYTVIEIDEAGEVALTAIEAGWMLDRDENQQEIAREMEAKGITRSEAIEAIVAKDRAEVEQEGRADAAAPRF